MDATALEAASGVGVVVGLAAFLVNAGLVVRNKNRGLDGSGLDFHPHVMHGR